MIAKLLDRGWLGMEMIGEWGVMFDRENEQGLRDTKLITA